MLIAFRELVEPRKQDADSLQRALTVGWCVELVRGMGEGQEKKSPKFNKEEISHKYPDF